MVTSKPRAYRKFESEESSLELWRLQDDEYASLRGLSFPIHGQGMHILGLMLADRREGKELMLPKVLIMLEQNYGESSRRIDDWKQTFSFPLLMRFTKAKQSYPYLLRLEDFRGSLEFNFYRVVDDLKYAEMRRDAYQQFIEGEFGQKEMRYWISYLWGYLHAGSEVWCRYKVEMKELEPFFRHFDSNHIIYGFANGKFFEYQVESEKKYDQHVARLRQKYGKPDPMPEQEIESTQELLQFIWQLA